MEVLGEAVVPGGDAAEIFEASEHALDGVSVSVEIWREAVFPDAIGLWRDVWRRALGFDLSAHGVGVVAFVAMHEIARRHLIEQNIGGRAIRDLAARQQERDGSAVSVGQRVDFCGASAARTADRLAVLPPFPPEAQRCALTAELSISNAAGGPPAVARA